MTDVRHALIDTAGNVVSVVMLDPDRQADPKQAWPVPKGHQAVASDTANPGDHWDGANFTRPT